MKGGYGECRITIDIPKNFKHSEPNAHCFLIKCTYHKDPYSEAKRLISLWRETALYKTIVSIPEFEFAERASGKYWYPTMVQMFYLISLSLKLSVFAEESESRLIFFSESPDSECDWHMARATKKLADHTLIQREYLPVKLKSYGITAKSEL